MKKINTKKVDFKYLTFRGLVVFLCVFITYVALMVITLYATPAAFVFTADVQGLNFEGASYQTILSYWVAPSVVLVSFIAGATFIGLRRIWRKGFELMEAKKPRNTQLEGA